MSEEQSIRLEESWLNHLHPEFAKGYMVQLKDFLRSELQSGQQVFPRGSEYFLALDLTPLDRTKVVIIGQDPYHGPGQAHGLCFSVKPGVPAPPSLINIYKEMEADLGIQQPGHGFLQHWAEQGVLLLNSVLTVRRGQAGSHATKGWERFTDRVIALINEEREGVVFLLWGSYAQKKGQFIDRSKHLTLTSPHPSPLSASRGFFGCKHFSQANHYLEKRGQTPIDWQLPTLH